VYECKNATVERPNHSIGAQSGCKYEMPPTWPARLRPWRGDDTNGEQDTQKVQTGCKECLDLGGGSAPDLYL